MGEPWLQDLNPEQRQVVEHGDGPLLVLAGAGSGKTRAITCRVAHLIAHRGVPADSILTLTFTNRAARELRERVMGLCPPGAAEAVVAGTFHSFGARLLRRHAPKLGRSHRFAIYDDDDQAKLLKRLLAELGVSDRLASPAEARSWLERVKRSLGGPEGLAPPGGLDAARAERLWRAYEAALLAADAFDFGDLISGVVRLLRDHPEVRERTAARHRHVLVDEYQDTDGAQAALLMGLTGEAGNLVVVGDDDQAIYGWRGADIRNILDFPAQHPGCPVIRLERNYRSSGAVLEAADAVIARNLGRMGKRLVPTRAHGLPVEVVLCMDGRDEANRVADAIAGEVAAGDAGLAEFAILYRLNAQSRPFEDALRLRGVPHEVIGGTRFYGRAEVKDVLAYARLALNPRDSVACLRVINAPPRGIGKRTVERIIAAATPDEGAWGGALAVAAGSDRAARAVSRFVALVLRLADAAEALPPTELLRTILSETRYADRLSDKADDTSRDRLANLSELMAAAAEVEAADGGQAHIADFLELASLHSEVDSYRRDSGQVSLMTLHSAKGLEFRTVFLTGLEDGLFPLRREEQMDEEEERRLCYVGMTRAKDRLVLTRAARRMLHGETRVSLPSRFLRDVPGDALRGSLGGLPSPTPPAPPHPMRPRRPDPFPDYDTPVQELPRTGAVVEHEELGRGTVVGTYGMGATAHLAVRFEEHGLKKVVATYLTLVEDL